jgi:hypothetical protein
MRTRICWNEDQIESLAKVIVRLRAQNMFTPLSELLAAAQDECLPDNEHRKLCSIRNVPLLYERTRALWEAAVHAEPTPPQIIQIPVEKPVDYLELASRLDAPTLMALLTKQAVGLLEKIHWTGTAEHHAATAKTAPPISLFAPPPAAKLRPPRVAFCGVDLPLFAKLRTELETGKILVELRGVDLAKKGQSIPLSADFVVFMKNATGGLAWKNARAAYPDKRVFVIENNLPAAVQKMRDIAAMQLPA